MHRFIFLFLIFPFTCFAQNRVNVDFIDSLVQASMEKFPQAGIAIAVIQDNQVTHKIRI